MPAISRIRLALFILPILTISQPSTPRLHSHSRWLLLTLRNELLDHFTEPFDASRIVDLLPEHHGGGGDAYDFSIENLVADAQQVALVVGAVHHGDESLRAGLDHALQLDLVDQESRRSGRALARLQFRR